MNAAKWINAAEALKLFTLGIAAGTVVFVAPTWYMLFRLRKRVRRNRQLRKSHEAM